MVMIIGPGHRHDAIYFKALLETGAVKRTGRGRPRLNPRRIVADKGYTGRERRAYLRRRGIRITIPRLTSERRRGPFRKDLYRERNRIERLFCRLKQYRRIATRYEKRAANFHAMVLLAAIILWL
jgi:transposase